MSGGSKNKRTKDNLNLLTIKLLLSEMKEYHKEAFTPVPEVDLVWVLSGPEIDFDSGPDEQEIHKVVNEYNQTKLRFEEGINSAKNIAARKLKKNEKDVLISEYRKYAPIIYWNAKADSINAIKIRAENGFFEEEYGFPKENIFFSQSQFITNTEEQFVDFIKTFSNKKQKVLIVSDAYHLPRVARFGKKYSRIKSNKNTFLLHSIKQPVNTVLAKREIERVINYYFKNKIIPENP
jgi:hypothetical protein